jgi:hypothetical protein
MGSVQCPQGSLKSCEDLHESISSILPMASPMIPCHLLLFRASSLRVRLPAIPLRRPTIRRIYCVRQLADTHRHRQTQTWTQTQSQTKKEASRHTDSGTISECLNSNLKPGRLSGYTYRMLILIHLTNKHSLDAQQGWHGGL